jgi:hypothetical protein
MLENGAESLKMARHTSLIIVASVRPALWDRHNAAQVDKLTIKKLWGPNSRYMHCTVLSIRTGRKCKRPTYTIIKFLAINASMCLWIMMKNNYCLCQWKICTTLNVVTTSL